MSTTTGASTGNGSHTPTVQAQRPNPSTVTAGSSKRETADKAFKANTTHPDQDAHRAREQGWVCVQVACQFYNQGVPASNSMCGKCSTVVDASCSLVEIESRGVSPGSGLGGFIIGGLR
ncbi:hypothetical protein T440DRAFT_482548 [Plenodomus tracheiphilus IPT5]|uniref:RanBP2-type domain-containing protein n=1 Tax=Plenodomus tracheiphilus IPT5 TaxID=1408161 RepID=A0A6A7AU21_9PLEO|nr:hypothetical protein T440DRAFT_482548 [Plenodomus tracheiphilus IPT5]